MTLLVFSTVSSRFGPRLMPRFLRDRMMQMTLGMFLATFLHSLLTFAVAGQRGHHQSVPQLTVLADVALVFASFGFLVIYNNHIAQGVQIQTKNILPHIVENMLAAISRSEELRVITTPEVGSVPEDEPVEALRARCVAQGRPVGAAKSGYVQKIDHKRLLQAANRHGFSRLYNTPSAVRSMSRSATPSAWPRPGSSPRWAASATVMITPSPKPSTVCSRAR